MQPTIAWSDFSLPSLCTILITQQAANNKPGTGSITFGLHYPWIQQAAYNIPRANSIAQGMSYPYVRQAAPQDNTPHNTSNQQKKRHHGKYTDYRQETFLLPYIGWWKGKKALACQQIHDAKAIP